VQREPSFHRAWYNLGLLFAQSNRLLESVKALRQAETVAPTVADYPYALATVLLRSGDPAGAKAAAERTLKLDPAHPAARQLLRSVP
jgi:cytochrome c-type biogenesis protein CcmH/NrfG